MFSQRNEEQFILAATPASGRFLDIGAWDARKFSNTRALFERGWGGVLIEPSPGPAENLRREYVRDNNVRVVEAAVTLDGNPIRMWITEDALSTATQAVYDVWKVVGGYQPSQIEVKGIAPESLVKWGPFDFISVDAEGMSADIALRLLALGARPACWCIEYDNRLAELLCEFSEYSAVYTSSENVVLVKR